MINSEERNKKLSQKGQADTDRGCNKCDSPVVTIILPALLGIIIGLLCTIIYRVS